jgi:hypothetical protein
MRNSTKINAPLKPGRTITDGGKPVSTRPNEIDEPLSAANPRLAIFAENENVDQPHERLEK